MPNNIIHLPGNINASQILYEDNLNIKSKINNVQTSVAESNDFYDGELERIETEITDKTTELNQKISNVIDASCIETQALAYSSTNPNTIYFSTDTNCIIINGEIYGRGQHLSNVFKLIPSDKTIGSTGYNDTNVIYIQPDGTNFTLYYYSTNNTWESIGNIAFDIAIDASDITYDLTNTPDLGSGDVQSAIEALDGKVEDLRDEVLGDEWVDEIFGRKADWIRTGCFLNKEGKSFSASSVTVCFGIKVNGGETFHGISRNHSGESIIYVYDYYIDRSGSGNYVNALSTPIAKTSQTSYDGRPIDEYITLPQNARMVVVTLQVGWAEHPYDHVYSDRGTPISIVDKTGYKINTWTDDEIITSNTLVVGDVVSYWSDGTRYGGRGVRLDVKEGDKVLLDTYSPEMFGLIFTDENRVIKALYDDRRFDGVWTAPCDGYCYIQDVLYRDNFHYSSAHGHLAYMAYDARKSVVKDEDWYNEFSPRIMQEGLPIEVNKTGNTQTYIGDGGAYAGANYVSLKEGKFVLIATRLYTYANSVMAGTTLVTGSWHNSSATATQISSGGSSVYVSDGYNWGYRIYIVKQNYTGTVYNAYWNASSTEANHHKIDKAYMHSFDNYADAYHLAEKIVHGEVEVDNLYGVRENDVDLVRNTIGLQSINDLGYNILDYGATLPIDEEGYKYAKEIYDRYKDNPPTGNIRDLFANDQKLVYFPNIDLSNATTIGGSTTSGLFFNCKNLKAIPPLNLTGTIAMAYCFQSDMSLKKVESLGNIKPTTMTNTIAYCYSLEYVGKIDTSECYIFWGFLYADYSLKRVEEIDVSKVSTWGSNNTVQWPGNTPKLEYILIKNMFKLPSKTSHNFTSAPKWGINSEENPDARQSLVDSLLTYSYDRVNDPDGLGTTDTTCTITLSANTYAQLTTEEINAITAKGYTLTHP